MKKITSGISLLLSCALCISALPAAAFATVEDNKTALTDEEASAYIEQGSDATSSGEDESISLAGSSSAQSKKTNDAVSLSVDVYAYSGSDMFETAAMEAKDAYPSGSKSAIIAGPGGAWVDSLAATGLASAKGPILFAGDGYLPDVTLDALNSLGVKSVVIVGGEAAVSPAVATALESNGITVEARLAGSDCFATQMEIFNYGVENNVWAGDYLFVATYSYFADALSASPMAFSAKAPIFLVDKNGNFNDEQEQALLDQADKGNFKYPVAIGGTTVVSEETLGFLDFISGYAGGSMTATRLSSDDMFGTSLEAANWAVSSLGFSWNSPSVATGYSPYDSLAGATLAGTLKSPLLLAGNSNLTTIDAAASNASSIKELRFLGGEACITMRERMEIADKIGFPWAAIPDFKVYVDAGHGWNDTNNGAWASGAVGCGYYEADLTKELADKVASILQDDYGVDVFLNDDGGWYALRHAEAISQGCDALVSIHFNAGGGTGTESLIHEYNASWLSPSWQNSIHPSLIEGTGLYDRGKKSQEVAILGGYLPATLLEICFIDDEDDMNQYQSRKDFIAHKIAEGIVTR